MSMHIIMTNNSPVAVGFIAIIIVSHSPLSIAVVEFLGTNVCFGYNLTVHIAREKESVTHFYNSINF